MTVYAETSALLRWLFNQTAGDEVLRELRAASRVVCSRLTLVELRRVIRRVLVAGEIAESAAEDLLAEVARAASHWGVLELSREVTDRAEAAFPIEPLRTLDALHLASALLLRQSTPDLQLLSTDDRIRRNAGRLGIPVLPGLV